MPRRARPATASTRPRRYAARRRRSRHRRVRGRRSDIRAGSAALARDRRRVGGSQRAARTRDVPPLPRRARPKRNGSCPRRSGRSDRRATSAARRGRSRTWPGSRSRTATSRRAESRLEESADLFGELGDWGGLSWAYGLLAFVRYNQGRLEEAAAIAEHISIEGRETGNRWAVGMMNVLLANVALWSGRTRECAERGGEADRAVPGDRRPLGRGDGDRVGDPGPGRARPGRRLRGVARPVLRGCPGPSRRRDAHDPGHRRGVGSAATRRRGRRRHDPRSDRVADANDLGATDALAAVGLARLQLGDVTGAIDATRRSVRSRDRRRPGAGGRLPARARLRNRAPVRRRPRRPRSHERPQRRDVLRPDDRAVGRSARARADRERRRARQRRRRPRDRDRDRRPARARDRRVGPSQCARDPRRGRSGPRRASTPNGSSAPSPFPPTGGGGCSISHLPGYSPTSTTASPGGTDDRDIRPLRAPRRRVRGEGRRGARRPLVGADSLRELDCPRTGRARRQHARPVPRFRRPVGRRCPVGRERPARSVERARVQSCTAASRTPSWRPRSSRAEWASRPSKAPSTASWCSTSSCTDGISPHATGLDERIAPDDVERTQAQADAFGDAMRGPRAFGAPVDPPPGADAQARLLAFLGRRP